jgi:hypothetical protein
LNNRSPMMIRNRNKTGRPQGCAYSHQLKQKDDTARLDLT